MTRASSLGELIDAIGPGEPRLLLPSDVSLALPGLVVSPLIFDAVITGDRATQCITPHLRELARTRDPVTDRHAAWLVAVVCIASGMTPEHDATLPSSTSTKLTAEGRAWLVQQTLDAVATGTGRDVILAAVPE